MTDPTREPGRPQRTSAAGSPGVPRWVKVFGIVAAVVVAALLLVMLLVGGEHGPGRHMSSAAGEYSTVVGTPTGAGPAVVRE